MGGGGLLSRSFEVSGVRIIEPRGATNPRCEIQMLVLAVSELEELAPAFSRGRSHI